ncbi:hypothetical protein EE612_050059 [Oryza sativa]|nr:hypothetical protein EE612_050059 [Oryza sativa]
MDQKLWLAN